jgi:hypothetical protein
MHLFSFPARIPRWGVLILSGLAALWLGCGSEEDRVPDVPLDLTVVRADSLMREASLALVRAKQPDFQAAFEAHLASERTFFGELIGLDQIAQQQRLSPEQADSLLVMELGRVLADSNMLHLLDTVRMMFPYHYDFAARLTPALKRLVYHFPELELPQFRTHVSGYVPAQEMRQVDQILPTPHYFSLGLHYFMGPTFPYYSPTLPGFIKQRFDPAYLEVMTMWEIAEGIVAPPPPGQETMLVDDIIRVGIKQYFMRRMLPQHSDSICLRYSSAQMEWAQFYEERIYKELMDDLFQSDFQAKREYLSDKPYTTSLSSESAPRLGEYLGWKIVAAYMDRQEEVTLAELCRSTDYQQIFRAAKYRP